MLSRRIVRRRTDVDKDSSSRPVGYFAEEGPNLVVLGGGTGSYALLCGLKHYAKNITALVNMSDNGGSTGALRDEYGVLPPGDVRQCLVALSEIGEARELFNYRFDSGSFEGHSFGNLFLAAAEKLTGSFENGVELASEMLRIQGAVRPITQDNVHVRMKTVDGKIFEGEDIISYLDFSSSRPEIWLEPDAAITDNSRKAILDADMIIIAPGNLYGSLAPVLKVSGVAEAIKESRAKTVYVCNLMTHHGQTDNFSVIDLADEIERIAGLQILDYVLYNNNYPSPETVKNYAEEGATPVLSGRNVNQRHWTGIASDLLANSVPQIPDGDKLASHRTLIRHDSSLTARSLMRVYFS